MRIGDRQSPRLGSKLERIWRVLDVLDRPGVVRHIEGGEVRGLVLTPSPMIPMMTIVTKSSHVTLSHCPKDGLVAIFITSGRLVS
jgi:hypothetical protein